MKVFELIFLFVCIFKSIGSYDILAIFPHEGRSHHNVFAPVIRRLASGGHNMTVIGYYSFKVENKHFREIILEDTMKQGEYFFDLKSFVDVPWSISQAMIPFVLTDLGVRSCQVMLSNSKIQNLLKQNIKFDLILAEFFNSECIHIFKDQFDVPLVGISASTIMPWHNDRFGNPDNPSYIPNNHLWHEMKMNFFERVENVLGLYWHNIFYWILTMKNQNKIESFSERRLRLNHAKISNTSLLLANSHFSLTYPRPLVPGVIEVGGIHIEDKKMLPWIHAANNVFFEVTASDIECIISEILFYNPTMGVGFYDPWVLVLRVRFLQIIIFDLI
ncbi:hypothetical protein HHI36_010525 [Cryptolaemus montrouzieri]|uniref:Uncharacterized protein n=1 Tax=Cryptolaemus montrouzieri TaxID=559131 RepID=A0ABD2MJ06_9CUCU